MKGIGTDLVDLDRFRHALDRTPGLVARLFCEEEQAYAQRRDDPTERYAARFAAKEAVLKVLGTGWRGKIAWTDVEVRPEPSGQPKVSLSGECERIAKELGISRWHVSISHIETHATASAIGMRGEG